MTMLPASVTTTGFVSSCLKAFKLQMVAQTPATAAASSNYYLNSQGGRKDKLFFFLHIP